MLFSRVSIMRQNSKYVDCTAFAVAEVITTLSLFEYIIIQLRRHWYFYQHTLVHLLLYRRMPSILHSIIRSSYCLAYHALPGSCLDISIQRFPSFSCNFSKILSSSSVHGSRLSVGSNWLYHLSLHCFPSLPGSRLEISDHFVIPLSLHFLMTLSSSAVHLPFIKHLFLI